MDDCAYLEKSAGAEVYPHLRQALEHFDTSLSRIAVDVGCGSGRDTLFLIERGFTVHAFDKDSAAISRLKNTGSDYLNKSLFPQVSSFKDYEYPKASLITACSSLFFCDPSVFDVAWNNIVGALCPGGVFCGHFLGPNDSWAKMGKGDLTIHTRPEACALFDKRFEIIETVEFDEPGKTLLGKSKHWHTFSVVALKRGAA